MFGISKWIAFTEQGGNQGTLMNLDGVSYSAFIQLCRVILSRLMNPTVRAKTQKPKPELKVKQFFF